MAFSSSGKRCNGDLVAVTAVAADIGGAARTPTFGSDDARHICHHLFDLCRAVVAFELDLNVELIVGQRLVDQVAQRETDAAHGHEEHAAQRQRDQRHDQP
jgi:hypothetical protein